MLKVSSKKITVFVKNDVEMLFIFWKQASRSGCALYIAEGLAQWLRSLPPNPEVPGSIPGLVEG